jgi:hypothetical protein
MAKPKGPMNSEHLAALDKLLKSCAETAAYCESCEACDLDVDPEKAKNAEQLAIARKIKAKFFPDAR